MEIFALREAARETIVKRRKLSGGRCTTEYVLWRSWKLGRFTFNPIYVIGNKLALILLVGSSFLVDQGAPAKKVSSQGHIHNLSRRLKKLLGAFAMLQIKYRTFE